MQLFYARTIEDGIAKLEAEDAHHCLHVLRKKIGDEINFIDGVGGLYAGRIIPAPKKACWVKVEHSTTQHGVGSHFFHLAVAPTKNMDRYEWLLEKATELGIDEFTPLICERSERRVVKTERLEKIALSATKQSLKATLPKIHQPTGFDKFLQRPENLDCFKFIAHCAASEKEDFWKILRPGQKMILLIGPEGDFSSAEVSLAVNEGWTPISLGPNRLRTETAAIAVCCAVYFNNI